MYTRTPTSFATTVSQNSHSWQGCSRIKRIGYSLHHGHGCFQIVFHFPGMVKRQLVRGRVQTINKKKTKRQRSWQSWWENTGGKCIVLWLVVLQKFLELRLRWMREKGVLSKFSNPQERGRTLSVVQNRKCTPRYIVRVMPFAHTPGRRNLFWFMTEPGAAAGGGIPSLIRLWIQTRGRNC